MKYVLCIFIGIILGYLWAYNAYKQHFVTPERCFELIEKEKEYKQYILYRKIMKTINPLPDQRVTIGTDEVILEIRRIK